jgi:hypothetical protein
MGAIQMSQNKIAIAAEECALEVYADGHDPELKGRALALWAVGSGFKAGVQWRDNWIWSLAI